MPIEVGSSTPGNHPEAGPDNAIQRNTAVMGKLVNAVASHEKTMAAMATDMQAQMVAMAEHRKLMDAHFKETSRVAKGLEDLVNKLGLLNKAVPDLQKAISKHTPELRRNTEAVTKFRL